MQAELSSIKQSLSAQPPNRKGELLPTRADLYTCCTASTIYTDSLLYLLGTLLIGFSGVSIHCKSPNCKRCRQVTIFYFHCIFPSWILARALIGTLQYSQTQGLTLRNVHLPNVRPTTDKIFTLVMRGNLKRIREEFYEKRSASPFDVDSRGNTLLWVSTRLSAQRLNLE